MTHFIYILSDIPVRAKLAVRVPDSQSPGQLWGFSNLQLASSLTLPRNDNTTAAYLQCLSVLTVNPTITQPPGAAAGYQVAQRCSSAGYLVRLRQTFIVLRRFVTVYLPNTTTSTSWASFFLQVKGGYIFKPFKKDLIFSISQK